MIFTTHLHHASIHSKIKRSLDILGSLVGLLILAILFMDLHYQINWHPCWHKTKDG